MTSPQEEVTRGPRAQLGPHVEGLYRCVYANDDGTPHFGKYEGDWQACRPHGNGCFTSPNFSLVGERKKGMRHGHGEATYASGAKYVGKVHDGKRSGPGELTWVFKSARVGLSQLLGD
eukprot:jgi/Botrbrau1/10725/Bobra.357_1s0026.1